MRHTNPQAACILCQRKIEALKLRVDEYREVASYHSQKRHIIAQHKTAYNRRAYEDTLRSYGLKKNRYDGHWE